MVYNKSMRYSQTIGKTLKEAPKDETSKNAQLLTRAGYISKEMAGVYVFLPLGLKTLNKIVEIIREEIVAVGGQELQMTALQNPDSWKKSGRWGDDVVDIWFKTKLKNDTEIGLGTTHEEPLAALMSRQINSYKDLPSYPFQIQTKFRNEVRAKNGLLRTREFLMKDLYSFNKDEEELDVFYGKVTEAYFKIFSRAGIGEQTYLTFASGGTFSKYSHEFQTVCESGEDTIYIDRKKKIGINKEVLTGEVLADLGVNKEDLEEVRAIEVGNIFKQKTRFSEPLGLFFTDEEGKRKPVIMGAYGIGPARLMATVVELFGDDKGIVWPESISPAKLHLVGLNLEDEGTAEIAETVYKTLMQNKLEVLFDDREDATAGTKFSDADLIGIPYRAVVSRKNGTKIELKKRTEEKSELLTLEELLQKIS
ncbi:MAG: Prolyl-tRNA synthetase [candidate division WWE3 bacterium GW2011_GWF2_41_45]|uniref:Proline--tRNA ligase n=2 Tax=Katanobacteria TaxID=422282 RepID=A0A0G0VT65_UNCKA|nr:MAG: Prolyl-tRNA synthetase [candidate division WWE3 bacterium GW2011_GWC2_41_23]KKS08782.1 MAG: Prolyl-tRNA synthetase [candidate division WWE3 bacterium GW2011_GWF2_41_45]KKS19466.1 MAG: Prolyl-tRNA synthetase [candidate division WWE3 bacterium GW2011_GWE1_41_72]KKS27388.1 MAG: Prolyl-tRNA synthetase [candidate division WWE3 bacterium GW2011_GWC1_42_102]KKS28509.1 MAG: Prolyl-tRNA synthetase [candidate division WWE3 bacterium GW2011_GWD2_42_11]KKS59579.1 MAG: Prolyl-tRNA synthetase [candi